MKFSIVKQLNGTFKLAYDSDYEKGKKLKVGEILECDIKKPRNYQFHKKFFALIEMVFQNQDSFTSKEYLRAYLTMQSGFVETIKTDKGVMYLPKSISFGKMDEIEFSNLYSKFLDVCSEFLNTDNETLNNNLTEFY